MITRLHTIATVLPILFAALSISGCANTQSSDYVQFIGEAQGGTFYITYKLPDGVKKETVHESVYSLLKAVDRSISGYNKGSILSKINDNQDIALDSIFVRVFEVSKEIYHQSNGAFDPSAAPLFDLWGFGFSQDTLATKAKVDSVRAFIGMDKTSLIQAEDGTWHLKKSDSRIKLNFNAIAQGLSCDLVAELLQSYGCHDFIITIGGGEIVCQGKSARGDAWRIMLDKPLDGNDGSGKLSQDILNIEHGSVATSGNYRKYYIKDGRKYSHTIDPATGYPVNHSLLSATIIAPTSAIADAYATWLMVAGIEKATEIVADLGVEAYLVYGEQDDMKVWHTPGLVLDSEKQ